MTIKPTSLHSDEKIYLTRAEAAAALRSAGFPISKATLATLATRGGGPAYGIFGKTALYPRQATIEWAEARMKLPTAGQ